MISAAAAAATALMCCTAALAAAPAGGGTYRGHLGGRQSKVAVSFKVSGDGRTVQGVTLSALPLYCSGNGPPATRIVFEKGKVTAKGTFVAKGRDLIATGPIKGSVAATLQITGTFAAGRRASGTLTTTYTGPAKRCSGRSPYAAKA